MATTSESLETIASNVTEIAKESALILENGRQTIVKETQTVVKEQVAPVNSLTDNDYKTIGRKLHQNIGGYFNYTDYILNVTDVSILPDRSGGFVLPIVYLDGDISGMVTKDDKVDLNYKIGRFNGQFYEGTCQCKYQGNTTWNTPKHNYSLSKMTDKLDFGWGAQKKYVLKGEFREGSYARNVVCAKLWADVVKSRTDTNDLLTRVKSTPNCCAVDGFPVMLVLNGNYRGVFTLNIPKDKWMMGMGDGEREALLQTDAGGVLNIQTWNAPLTKEILLTDDVSMTIEYVPDEDDVDWVVDSWNNIYNIVNNNQNNANYIDLLSPYVDITNAIDYYIYCCLLGNWDGINHNFLFSTFDGTKWFYTAYDLNFVFGLKGAATADPRTEVPTFVNFSNNNKLMHLFYTHSKDLIKSRYEVIRNSALSEANVLTKFTQFLSRIPERLRQVEYELYPKENNTFGEHLSQIMNWYRLRCETLDKQVESWNV